MKREIKYSQVDSSAIPNDLVENIGHVIGSFSTVLIKLSIHENGVPYQHPFGTGTFVTVGSASGILTAIHVCDKFSNADALGLTLIKSEHNVTVPWQHITRIDVEPWLNEEYGPDMSLLVLPEIYLSRIRPHKSFYLLGKKDNMSGRQDAKQDPWFVHGLIGERTTNEVSTKGFAKVKGLHTLSTMSYRESILTRGKYDYIEVLVDSGVLESPMRYRGTSGGGLWRVPLLMDPNSGLISVKNYILAGVAFYETEQESGKRKIRCHGPKSLDQIVLRATRATTLATTLATLISRSSPSQS